MKPSYVAVRVRISLPQQIVLVEPTQKVESVRVAVHVAVADW